MKAGHFPNPERPVTQSPGPAESLGSSLRLAELQQSLVFRLDSSLPSRTSIIVHLSIFPRSPPFLPPPHALSQAPHTPSARAGAQRTACLRYWAQEGWCEGLGVRGFGGYEGKTLVLKIMDPPQWELRRPESSPISIPSG